MPWLAHVALIDRHLAAEANRARLQVTLPLAVVTGADTRGCCGCVQDRLQGGAATRCCRVELGHLSRIAAGGRRHAGHVARAAAPEASLRAYLRWIEDSLPQAEGSV